MTTDDPTRELERLLAKDAREVELEARAAYDRAAGAPDRPIVLFGAGGLGRRTLAGLARTDLRVVAFADNNEALWGREVDGLPVLSPADAADRWRDDAVFVVTIFGGGARQRMAALRAQLDALSCRTVISFAPLYWRHPEVLLPHYAVERPWNVCAAADSIRAAYALFVEPQSRAQFVAELRWRLELDFDGLPDPVAGEVYFPPELFRLRRDEVFVDCGAFDGDSVRELLTRYRALYGDPFGGRVLAFEPDPVTFPRLRGYVQSLDPAVRERIAIVEAAVGERSGTARFAATGSVSSTTGSGPTTVRLVTLDDQCADMAPTFIKADTEGYEPQVVAGARGIVSEHAPVLALCLYHCQDHLWTVPLAVCDLSDRYHFFLRPHGLEVWDLVLYAVPAERLDEASA